jgi:hypothetical protein
MTESEPGSLSERDTCQHLLHLSNISLDPADIVSVYWGMNQEFSRKLVTRIRTRFEVFVLESDSPYYEEDLEALEKSTGRSNCKLASQQSLPEATK